MPRAVHTPSCGLNCTGRSEGGRVRKERGVKGLEREGLGKWRGEKEIDPSTHATRSPISTDQRRDLLLFLARISVSVTRWGHKLWCSFCRFGYNRPNTAKRTGCRATQSEPTGYSKGKVDVFSLAATRVTTPCDLRAFFHFSPNGGRSLAVIYIFGTVTL